MQQDHSVSQRPEVIAEFGEAWPSGIAVSRSNRIFVSFPRVEEPPAPATLVEIRDGAASPFPDDSMNAVTAADAQHRFTSIHGIVFAPSNRLFALDTGATSMQGCDPAAAALYAIDLDHDAVLRRYAFAADVVTRTTYLNDVVIEYGRGEAGFAYITDSGPHGPNGIIVVDLESGRSWRRLAGHESVRVEAQPGFGIAAEGKALMQLDPDGTEQPITTGADGITLSSDGYLYWTPLGNYRFYRIKTDALADPRLDHPEVERHVERLDDRSFACDGLECDREGRVYFTDVTNNAIQRWLPAEHRFETIVTHPDLIWPDGIRLGPDRIVYITASQLGRSPQFNRGQDLRERPYKLFRAASDSDPAGF